MSHFYGTITGSRGKEVTRCGHKTTGLRTSAKTWRGEIEVYLWHDQETGVDRYVVSKRDNNCRTTILAEGAFDDDETLQEAAGNGVNA